VQILNFLEPIQVDKSISKENFLNVAIFNSYVLIELAKTGLQNAIATYQILGLKNWMSFWFSNKIKHLKFSDAIFNIRCNDFKSKFWDVAAITESFLHKIYNPIGFEIRETDTVIDVGAHIGGFSVLAAKVAKCGKVYSFEPCHENYLQLISNIKINKLSNIVAVNEAVSEKTGVVNLYYSKLCNVAHSLYQKPTFQKSRLKKEAKSIRLDDALKKLKIRKCDFLKMDCEGAEYEILLSLKSSMFNKIEKIVCEYHDPMHFKCENLTHTPEELIDFLESKGYLLKIEKISKYFGVIYARKR